jgi:hypothetical protein
LADPMVVKRVVRRAVWMAGDSVAPSAARSVERLGVPSDVAKAARSAAWSAFLWAVQRAGCLAGESALMRADGSVARMVARKGTQRVARWALLTAVSRAV